MSLFINNNIVGIRVRPQEYFEQELLLIDTSKFYTLNKSYNWIFLVHNFFFFAFVFARIFFLGIFRCMNFFFPPLPSITFLMVRPLATFF